MGFQLMSIMTSDDYSVLSHNAYKTEGISLPLEFDPLAVRFPLYDSLDTLLNLLATLNGAMLLLTGAL